MRKKLLCVFIILILFIFNRIFAATDEIPDILRSSGKIYVVVGVLVTVFIGIAIYLITLDNKITRFEKEMKEKKE